MIRPLPKSVACIIEKPLWTILRPAVGTGSHVWATAGNGDLSFFSLVFADC